MKIGSKAPSRPPARIRIASGTFPVAHVDQLLALYRQTFWAADRTPREVREMLRHTPITFSAWHGKKLVGFARLLTDFVYRAVLYDVIVDAPSQGRGVGGLLMQRIHSHPRLKRITVWYLATPDKHDFYEKFGWRHDAKEFMELRTPRPKPRG